ncbi:LysR family transcriptional regulator [Shinella sp. CPCC 101442]|uniref:LysR family transcriptional regulator n=1 Tax=Shinella sp. CPCC 101442 TaxID=2932265 RepID=UPI0021521888|nr:LysR family transcriptional regulator [Shinella sp. CPCC 101442]MCR6502781.1 LysR family transcriptional regulator [Shinella sp. CPCC 101442]
MNLSHVHTFVVVMETGNLNKAAAKLNVTQSTVTARINALEDLLGQKLLRRVKSGAELTATGSKFVKHAQILMQVWNQARHDTSLPSGFDDVCNLGCTDALWNGAGELWLNTTRSRCPTVAVNVESGSEAEMRPWIINSIVDVAIAYEAPPATGFSISPLFEDIFIEVATVERGLMRWDPMYVYVDHGEEFRRWHAETFPVDDTAVVTFTNGVFALNHILKWGGSAYLPYRIAKDRMDAGQIFEVKDAPRFRRTAYLARNTTRTENWSWFDEVHAGFREAAEELELSALR